MPGHSKIQVQVLKLYRQLMRAAKNKPGVAEHVRSEFKKNAIIPRSDTLRIEYLMRRGHRQLEVIKKSTVQSIGSFQK